MLVRIGIAAKIQGVSPSTLRRWEKEERIKPERRTKGGHRRYKLAMMLGKEEEREGESKKNTREVVGYARVSATKQRKELIKQKEHIISFANQQGWKVKKVFTDIASGMNEGRKRLNKLLNEVASTQPCLLSSQ